MAEEEYQPDRGTLLELWMAGKDAWNKYVSRHPNFDVDFSGLDLECELRRYCRPVGNLGGSFADFKFPNGNVSFEGTSFKTSNMDLTNIVFGEGLVNFNNAKFECNNVSFIGTNFGDGDFQFHIQNLVCRLDFTDTIFGAGTKLFSDNDFGTRDIIFTGTDFGNGDIDFSKCKFGGQRLSFDGVKFGAKKTDFSDAYFSNTEVSFHKATFGDGDVSFTNTIFQAVSFANTIFGKGKKDFSKTQFGVGLMSFHGADFGAKKTDFSDVDFSNTEVSFHKATFGDGDVSFTNTIFKTEVSFHKATFGDGDVSFTNTIFKTEVSFHKATFGNGDVSFTNTIFQAGSFANTIFGKGKKDFSKTKFGVGLMSFHGADFGDGNLFFLHAQKEDSAKAIPVDFREVTFGNGETNFTGMNFGDNNVYFSKAKFGDGDVLFNECQFSGSEVNFNEAQFGKNCLGFNAAIFETQHVSFKICKFTRSKLDFANAVFNGEKLTFTGSKFIKCESRFSESTIKGRFYFGNVKLGDSSFIFDDVEFNGRAIFLHLEETDKVKSLSFNRSSFNNSFDISASKPFRCVIDLLSTKVTHQISLQGLECSLNMEAFGPNRWKWRSNRASDPADADRFRRLKELALANRDHAKAIDFGIEEMRAARWHSITNFGMLFLEFIFWSVSDYGRSISRPFYWLAAVWMIFASIYSIHTFITCNSLFKQALFNSGLFSASHMIGIIPGSAKIRDVTEMALFGPFTPLYIDYFTIFQGVISLIILFQIGLVIRNKFRV